MLLDLHNSSPKDNPIRAKIVQYIREYGAANKKAHWTRAIVADANGTLKFDEQLYDNAVYRGKQETYFESAQDAYKKLKSAVEFVSHFQEQEGKAIAALASGPSGTPLLSMPDYSPSVAMLKENAAALKATVEAMEAGVTNNLVAPRQHAVETTVTGKGDNFTQDSAAE
jgi:short-subunit dehydrogenase involved in D-alanine esterification of teichoic acids